MLMISSPLNDKILISSSYGRGTQLVRVTEGSTRHGKYKEATVCSAVISVVKETDVTPDHVLT
jgi:hypothetical protein